MPILRSPARRTAACALALSALIAGRCASPMAARPTATTSASGARPILAGDASWVSPPAFLALEDDAVFFVDGTQLVAGRIEDPADGWFEVGRSAPLPAPDAEPDALDVRADVAWLAWSAGDAHRLSVYDVAGAAGRAGGSGDAGDDPALLSAVPLPCRPARLRAAGSRAIVQCAGGAAEASLQLIELTTAPSFQLAVTALTDLPAGVTAFDWRDGRLAILDRPAESWPRLTWYAALDPRQPHERGRIQIETRIASDVLLTGAYAIVRVSPISAVADVNAYDLGGPSGARMTGTWRLSLGAPVAVAPFDANTILALDPYAKRLWSIDVDAPAAAAETELLRPADCAPTASVQMAAREGRAVVAGGCGQYVVEAAGDGQSEGVALAVTALGEGGLPDRAAVGPIRTRGDGLVAVTRAGIQRSLLWPDGSVEPTYALSLPGGLSTAKVTALAATNEAAVVWVGLGGQSGTPIRAVTWAGDGAPQWLAGAEIGDSGHDAIALDVSGDRLIAAIAGSGVWLYDVGDPAHPKPLAAMPISAPAVRPDLPSTAPVVDVAISGTRAFVLRDRLEVFSIRDDAVEYLGNAPTSGVRLAVVDGQTAVVATATGLDVIDASSSSAPKRTAALGGLEPPPGPSPIDIGVAAGMVGSVPVIAYRSGDQRVHFIALRTVNDPREFAVRQVPDSRPNRAADAFLAGPVVDAAGGGVFVAGWQRWYRYGVAAVPVARSLSLPWLARGATVGASRRP